MPRQRETFCDRYSRDFSGELIPYKGERGTSPVGKKNYVLTEKEGPTGTNRKGDYLGPV